MSVEKKIVYFERPGKENTDEVLSLIQERAEELGIKTVVLASTYGTSAVKAVKALKGLNVIVVSTAPGTRKPGQALTEENRRIIEAAGFPIFIGTHAFAGISRAVKRRFETVQVGDLMADTLKIFGEGIKVACEITMMAADANLINIDEPVIATGGSGAYGLGTDTAIVLKPVYAVDFFDIKIQDILCKPYFQIFE